MKLSIVLSFISLTAASCSQNVATTGDITSAEEAVIGGQPAIDGALNTQSTQAGAISKNDFSRWLGISTAEASVGCGTFAVSDTCSLAGVKAANYYGCTSWGGEISGSVILNYSNTTCLVDTLNGSVTRKALLTRVGLSAGTIYTDSSSNSSKNYLGGATGAGTELAYVGTGSYNLNVLGVRKTLNDSSGNTLFDLSVQTTSPISVTGNLLASRLVNGGTLMVYHNTAQYTATITPTNLEYTDSTCCHPVSGSLAISYAGSVTGSATVTFNPTCGSENIFDERRNGYDPACGLRVVSQ